MCEPGSALRSSHYVTGSDPFLELKGEADGGEAEGLGVGMTLGPRIASSSLSACWGRACKQTRCPAPASVRLRFPPAGWKGSSPLPSGGCSRNLLAEGRRWGYSGLWGCSVQELRSVWRIWVLFRAL